MVFPTVIGYGVPSGSKVLVKDLFTDDDDTVLTNHTPDIDTVGNGWVAGSTSWTIDTNAALTPSAANRQYMWIDSGATDVIITATLTIPGTWTSSVGLIARLKDGDECWFYIAHSSTGEARIYTDSAGFSLEDQSSGVVFTAGNSYDLKVVVSGNAHTMYVDSVQQAAVASDASFNTQTNVGLWTNGPTGDQIIDDFLVIPA